MLRVFFLFFLKTQAISFTELGLACQLKVNHHADPVV